MSDQSQEPDKTTSAEGGSEQEPSQPAPEERDTTATDEQEQEQREEDDQTSSASSTGLQTSGGVQESRLHDPTAPHGYGPDEDADKTHDEEAATSGLSGEADPDPATQQDSEESEE